MSIMVGASSWKDQFIEAFSVSAGSTLHAAIKSLNPSGEIYDILFRFLLPVHFSFSMFYFSLFFNLSFFFLLLSACEGPQITHPVSQISFLLSFESVFLSLSSMIFLLIYPFYLLINLECCSIFILSI